VIDEPIRIADPLAQFVLTCLLKPRNEYLRYKFHHVVQSNVVLNLELSYPDL